MSLKVRILQSLTRLIIFLVSLRISLFSEKTLIFNRCISGLMSNLFKKSWTVSITGATRKKNPQHHNKFMSGNFCTLNFKISTLCWYHMKRLTVQFRWHCTAMQCTVRIYSVCQIIVVTYLGKYFCNLSCGDGGRWT